ncbi:hypothetical protein XPA_009825 [Xanthoria parietina]
MSFDGEGASCDKGWSCGVGKGLGKERGGIKTGDLPAQGLAWWNVLATTVSHHPHGLSMSSPVDIILQRLRQHSGYCGSL